MTLWNCAVVAQACSTRPFEVTVVGKTHYTFITACKDGDLRDFFPPSLISLSVSIVSCDWEHFNDRNLVLLNSAGLVGHRCQDIPEAGSLSFWQPCTSVSSALLLRFLSSSLSSFSLLGPPQGDCQWERERARKGFFDVFVCLRARRLCVDCPKKGHVHSDVASTALLSVHTGLVFSWRISRATPHHAAHTPIMTCLSHHVYSLCLPHAIS